MAENRFPKQGTEAYFIYKTETILSVVKVVISKKWTDTEAYGTPTQVATVRILEILTKDSTYTIGNKITIDEPEDLLNKQGAIKGVFND